MLNFERETFNVVKASDLNAFISGVFPDSDYYDFSEQEDVWYGDTLLVNVDETALSDGEIADVRSWSAGDYSSAPAIDVILRSLITAGLVQIGTYLIKVD